MCAHERRWLRRARDEFAMLKETEHFTRDRFGWLCKRCRDAAREENLNEKNGRASQREERARFFREGEAEEREPRLSTRGLARWREEGGTNLLFCPICKVTEEAPDPE